MTVSEQTTREQTASEQFKQALRQSTLDNSAMAKALTLALAEMIELDIKTWVVPPEVTSPSMDPSLGYHMVTHVNILEGDTNNEISSIFVTDESYAEIRDFHLHQATNSRKILHQNLEILQHLFTILVGTMQSLSAPAATSLPPQPIVTPTQVLPPSSPRGLY